MKTKITNKEVKESASRIILLSSTDLLITIAKIFKATIYYNSGVYGWNYDVCFIDNVAFISGDRNFPYTERLGYELEKKLKLTMKKISEKYLKKYGYTDIFYKKNNESLRKLFIKTFKL